MILTGGAVSALELLAEDVAIEAREEGFYLFIRQKEGIGSVMLTESMELPDRSVATYALRAVEFNPVNGTERRLLNGRFLPDGHLSLIDSTPEYVERFRGPGFVILLPPIVQYGWPDNPQTRYGRHDLRQLIREDQPPYWFSIRTFEKPYGDYSGRWRDNPFEIQALHQAQTPSVLATEEPTDALRYHTGLVEGFRALSQNTVVSRGGAHLIDNIIEILRPYAKSELDLVVCLDTTGSMRPHLQLIRDRLVPALAEALGRTPLRAALVLFRDYMEEYLTKALPFRTDLDLLQRDLLAVRVGGGGDEPEAVLEALHTAAISYDWSAPQRVILLIGDAPPHPLPRGRITREMTLAQLQAREIVVHSIALPHR